MTRVVKKPSARRTGGFSLVAWGSVAGLLGALAGCASPQAPERALTLSISELLKSGSLSNEAAIRSLIGTDSVARPDEMPYSSAVTYIPAQQSAIQRIRASAARPIPSVFDTVRQGPQISIIFAGSPCVKLSVLEAGMDEAAKRSMESVHVRRGDQSGYEDMLGPYRMFRSLGEQKVAWMGGDDLLRTETYLSIELRVFDAQPACLEWLNAHTFTRVL